MRKKEISSLVIRRLPRYYRYLEELMHKGVTKISSTELGARMGTTASQIRQDLNCFGGFGQQGYGYNVASLHAEIGTILGLHIPKNAIMIGAGNLGHALGANMNMNKLGFKLVRIFDISPKVVGTTIGTVEVHHVDTLADFAKEVNIDIAILTLPKAATHIMIDRLSELGVKAIWNFSNEDIEIPGMIVENVHLSDSLMTLSYRVSESKQGETAEKAQ